MSRSLKTSQARLKKKIQRKIGLAFALGSSDINSLRNEDNSLQVSLNRHGNNRKFISKRKVQMRQNDRHKSLKDLLKSLKSDLGI